MYSDLRIFSNLSATNISLLGLCLNCSDLYLFFSCCHALLPLSNLLMKYLCKHNYYAINNTYMYIKYCTQHDSVLFFFVDFGEAQITLYEYLIRKFIWNMFSFGKFLIVKSGFISQGFNCYSLASRLQGILVRSQWFKKINPYCIIWYTWYFRPLCLSVSLSYYLKLCFFI